MFSLKKPIKNDIFKNMAILALGAGSAQAIGLAATPILTRIYSPSDFGLLSVFMSAVYLMAPFTNLRYAMAIPLPKSDGMAFNVIGLSITILVVFILLRKIPRL